MAILEQIPPQQLLTSCRDIRKDRTHERFCLELFRRAIVSKSQECWSLIYEQYVRLVFAWTLRFVKTNEQIGVAQVDDLVQDAFASFWRSYTPDHFKRATSIGSVLNYLQSCAWSSVQHARRKVRLQQVEWDVNPGQNLSTSHLPEQEILTKVNAEKLWQVVESSCSNKREEQIARLRFVDGLKPKEIIARFPEIAQTEQELYKVIRNIKDRIKRHPYMQELSEYQRT